MEALTMQPAIASTMLVMFAGNLGEQQFVQLNPFQHTARVTEGLASTASNNTIVKQLQHFARGIASKLFD